MMADVTLPKHRETKNSGPLRDLRTTTQIDSRKPICAYDTRGNLKNNIYLYVYIYIPKSVVEKTTH